MIFQNIEPFKELLVTGKRVIGLDFGSKKIGVAISDISRTIANPHSVIIRINNKKDLASIKEIIKDDYCGIVIGFPFLMSGMMSDACAKVMNFGEIIFKEFNLPIYLQDERLSTRAALNILSESNLTRKRKNAIDDKISASYVLQIVLDRMKYFKGNIQ